MHPKTKNQQTKTALDPALPAKPRTSHLSPAKKKQLELGDEMEHEHGPRREALEHAVEELDGD